MTDTILWRRLDLPGHEVGKLKSLDYGWELSGTAVFSHERAPCKLDYLVVCGSDWQTHSTTVKGIIGDRDIDLNVSVDKNRHWHVNGVDCPDVAGCTDIDFGFSPSTNLLPIRRLSLAIGEQVEVRAAWLSFPSLVFMLLPQTYRREAEGTFIYETDGGRFQRILEVNHSGFVISYPGLWQVEDT